MMQIWPSKSFILLGIFKSYPQRGWDVIIHQFPNLMSKIPDSYQCRLTVGGCNILNLIFLKLLFQNESIISFHAVH